jgi:hypothetical protein
MPEQKKVVKITVLLRIYFVVAETQVEREKKEGERSKLPFSQMLLEI